MIAGHHNGNDDDFSASHQNQNHRGLVGSSKEMTLEEELRSLSQGMMDQGVSEGEGGVMTPSDRRRQYINEEIEQVRSSL